MSTILDRRWAETSIEDLLNELGTSDTLPLPAVIGEESFQRLLNQDLTALRPVETMPARDGLPLAYRRYTASTSRVVLLIHGTGGHSGHMHTLAQGLAGRNAAQVYVPDVRGHGLSGLQRGTSVTHPDQLRDDIEDFIGFIAARVPGARIHVVGFSAGGGLLLRLADRVALNGIESVVLLSPYLGLDAPMTRPGIGGWITLYYRRLAALEQLNGMGIAHLNHLVVVKFNQPLSCRDGRETLAWSFNTVLAYGPHEWRSELTQLGAAAPVLLLAGSRDECFIPDAYLTAMEEVAPSGAARVLDGLGHWDLIVTPETSEALAAWLMAM